MMKKYECMSAAFDADNECDRRTQTDRETERWRKHNDSMQ